jgi:hypothetical protein
MKLFHWLLLLISLHFLPSTINAQITVEISVKHRFYIRHEPVLATVTVTNQTGRDITLADTRLDPWFSFQITSDHNQVVAPRNPDYHLDPLSIRSGATLKRTVNLNDLYTLGEFGIFRIRANIYFADSDRYFLSKPTHIEITEGRLIGRKTAGVPEGKTGAGQTHVFSLFAHQRGEQNILYIRVEDQDNGTVFCTNALGRLIDGAPPEIQFDSQNNLFILQLIAQRRFALSKIGVNGEFLGQSFYGVVKTRPFLRKLPDGSLQLVGGKREDAPQDPATLPPPLKLSDRPPGLPKG